MTPIALLLGWQTTRPKITLLSPIRPPKYANAEAKRIMERTFKLYDQAKSFRFDVSSSEGRHGIWFVNGMCREEGPRLTWTFDRATLFIANHTTRKFYSGPAKKSRIGFALERLGSRIDPSLWQLLYNRNPIRAVLDEDLKIAKAGRLKTNNVDCLIMRATGKGARIALLIGVADGLVYRITADVVNLRGKTVSTSDRVFTHVKLSANIPTTAFQIKEPAGYAAGPISTLLR